jgi:hypothetical protein
MICPTVAEACLLLRGWKPLSAIRVARCSCGCLPVLLLPANNNNTIYYLLILARLPFTKCNWMLRDTPKPAITLLTLLTPP